MKSQKEYQNTLPQQNYKLQTESPPVQKDRQSTGSELNNISPIPALSLGSSDILSSQNTNEKQSQHLLSNRDKLQKKSQNYPQFYQGTQANNYGDQDIQNQMMNQFYKRHEGGGFIGNQGDNYFEDCNQEGYNSINRQDYASGNLNLFSATGNYAQSTGNKLKQGNMIHHNRETRQGTCTEFDLTAKEISSNKRFDKNKKNTIISGRTSHSPNDGPPSNSETVKWAFSNKDSQETQKKISVINRESINAQDLISRSLKSHDSRAQSSQQTTSTKNLPNLKGKILDFANMDKNKHQIESQLFHSNSNNPALISSNTFDSQSGIQRNQEGKIISFLEDESQILINSQKKIISNSSIAGLQFKRHVQTSNINSKYLVKQKFNVPEILQSFIENTIECPMCHEQKVYDQSMQCSRLELPKSSQDIIKINLEKKYLTSREYYNVKIINDIIYNEQTHIVSVFKDYLIFDDISEFLKRFYNKLESLQRLPKMYEFYEKFSKVFPNYVTLPENKYLFKNIEKKQRLIDEKQNILQMQQEKLLKEQQNGYQLGNSAEKSNKNRHKDRFSSQQQNSSMNSNLSTNRMFDTKFIDSVANIKASGIIESMISSRINNSQYQDHLHNSSILIQQHLQQNMDNAAKKKKEKKALQDLDFGELISKFIAKDSESNIQQSSIMTNHNEYTEKKQDKLASSQRPSQQQTQKKPQVYEYQEKKLSNNFQPSAVSQTDNSKTMSENVSNGRPTSSKQQQHTQDNKRFSNGSAKSIPKNPQSEQPKGQQQYEMNKDGKVLNYNIYNNFNQYINNINNENYYISTAENQILSDEQQQQQLPKQATENGGSRSGSLQRNQSRSNLHNQAQQQMSLKTNIDPNTPIRSHVQKEVKTPTSVQGQEQNNNNIQAKVLKRIQQKGQKIDEQNPIQLQSASRLSHPIQKIENEQTQSPLNNYSQRNNIFTATVNSCRSNTETVVSRELSKEKKQNIQPIINKQSINQPQNMIYSSTQQSNQMFKNEALVNMVSKQMDNRLAYQQIQPIQNQDYTNNNVRSVERLKGIEEEIEKDYSKYINEYGLTKTAFAKAVNAIREQQQNNLQQNLIQQQQVHSVPGSTRQGRPQNSNEKKRTGSNNPRSGSTSQNRKQSTQSRQQNYKNALHPQESINDLYLNTNRNNDKQIRSVRAKTHLNSQNSSSCFQRSQKLSPDKYPASQLGVGAQSILGLTQTLNNKLNLNGTANYITLKAQPTKQSKQIKIKFPLNSQRNGAAGSKINSSQNQTPKRVKLQKTKSSSNIPICFTTRGNQQNPNLISSRGKITGQAQGTDMIILDELSQQMGQSGNPQLQYLLTNRTSQNLQDFYGSNGNIPPQGNFSDNIIQQYATSQQTFNSNSCGGTFATTSILNSPLSFRNQMAFIPNNAQQQPTVIQQQQNVRNNSKGRQNSNSRNGANSQHQSQKSITNNNAAHQRASSNNGVLQGSNNKNKKSSNIQSIESKRLSAGGNLAKKQQNLIYHQASSSNMQNQFLQFLMSQQSQHDVDITGNSVIQNLPSSTNAAAAMKLLHSNNTQSMKDLKSLKQQPTLLKDLHIIKAPKQGGGIILSQQQQINGLNTQRQGSQASILMVQQQQNSRKSSIGKQQSGKLTSRGEGSKKRIQQQSNHQQQMVVIPYQSVVNDNTITTNGSTNQYMQGSILNQNDLTSRIQSSLGMTTNYIDQSSNMMESKRILQQSKSQENFDLIRVAQRAAFEQQQQQQMLQNQQQLPPNKFLQNFKQQENQISISKIKLMPSNSSAGFNQQMIPLQSARNANNYENIRTINNNEAESQQQAVFGKQGGPTNIIIGPSFIDKQSSSRRTSAKFNPSSTRSNTHQQLQHLQSQQLV